MNLSGAVINFLGDSITEGAGASCVEKRYTDVLCRMFGLAKANNYGIGGTRFARQIVRSNEKFDQDFCMRYPDMDQTADAVVVFGGTNDFGHGDAPLGAMEDRTPDTFYGACHTLFNGLLSDYPGKPIVVVTPLHRIGESNPHDDGSKLCNGAPLSEYRRIIMEVALFYSLPVLDLYASAGIQPSNPIIRERLLPDGLHPNDEGHALIARRIGQFLQML